MINLGYLSVHWWNIQAKQLEGKKEVEMVMYIKQVENRKCWYHSPNIGNLLVSEDNPVINLLFMHIKFSNTFFKKSDFTFNKTY